jgi:hypothetical protein
MMLKMQQKGTLESSCLRFAWCECEGVRSGDEMETTNGRKMMMVHDVYEGCQVQFYILSIY